MKKTKLFFIGIGIIFLFSIFTPKYFLAIDILNYLPSFSLNNWQRPHNSILADQIYQFEPWRVFAKENIRSGEIPFWNGDNANGMPFFANPQAAVFFPLNAIYYFLPVKMALLLMPLLKLYLFFWFTFLYLQKIKVKIFAALLGTTAATFAGFPMVWLLWPQTNVFLFLPLLLLLIEKIVLSKKNSHRLFLYVSIAACLAWLGGHPETLFHIFAVSIMYAFVRLFHQKKKFFQFVLFIFLGIALSSFQLIPFLEYLLQSKTILTRQTGGQSGYLPITSFLFNFLPFLYGSPQKLFYRPIASFTNFQETIGGYSGVAVFLTALFGIIKVKKNSVVLFWISTILLCFFLSFNIFPFSFINSFPFIRLMANYRLIGIAGFGTCVLFAITISEIITKGVIKHENN